MNVTTPVSVQCSHDGCSSSFEVELPLDPEALWWGRLELAGRINIEAPKGWYIDAHALALCPDHNHHIVLEAPELPPEAEENAKGGEEPTEEVLALATKLQALAMDRSTTEHERAAAWARFGSLWKRYNLPDELGLKESL
jgi:hypothetical protein